MQHNIRSTFVLALAISIAPFHEALGQNWTQFRGPQGNGIASTDKVTLEIDPKKSKNVRWRTETPEAGWSSPITDGKRIWLTAARMTEATPKQKEAKLANVSMAAMKEVAGLVDLFAYCFDVESGTMLHNIPLRTVDSPNPIHPMNGYASPTGVIVGDRVVLHFGQYGTWCLDASTGRELWQRQLVVDDSVGPGSSLVEHQGKVIVTCDGMDQQFVAALSVATGDEVWRTPRPKLDSENGEYRKSYSSPILIEVDGKTQAVIPAAQWCVAYDPETGSEIWRLEHGKGFSITPMPLYVDGKIIMSTGYGKPDIVAIDPRGKGDITKTNILWRESRSGSVMPSMLSIDGLVYSISDGGIVSALSTSDGSLAWRQRLGGKFSASPFAVGRNVIVADHDGKVTIFRAGDSYQETAKYEFDEQIMASPVPIGNDLLVRTKAALYRFGSTTN